MRLIAAFALMSFMGISDVSAQGANPYSAALTVNDRVITYYDIDQRVTFLDALGAPGDLQELAIEQLTEDRLKVQAADQLGIELPEGAIEAGLEEFATTRGLEVDQVLEILAARDIDRQTIDDFIESGLAWRDLVAARFRTRALPSEEEIDVAIEARARTPIEEIQLAEIALPFGERGEAETLEFANELYARLAGGADFGAAVRQFSRSATSENGGIMPPISANRLPPAIRSQVLLLRPGQITRPLPIGGGVAILKVVAINARPPEPIDPGDEAARDAVRQELFAQRITSFGQGYLQELTSDALIIAQ